MSLSDCPKCWDTPCTCGYQYWFMTLDRLEQVAKTARKALADRRGGRRPPADVREELERQKANAEAAKRMTSEDWHRTIEIPAAQLMTAIEEDARMRAPVSHALLDAYATRERKGG